MVALRHPTSAAGRPELGGRAPVRPRLSPTHPKRSHVICASSKGESAQFFPRRLAEFQKGIHSYPPFYQLVQFFGCLWGGKKGIHCLAHYVLCARRGWW